MGERTAPFSIDVRADDDALVVAIAGELDLEAAEHLRPCLTSAIETSDGRVVIDMADLTLIDSTGIALLVTVHRAAAATGRSLELLNVGPRALAVFELTGVTETLLDGDAAR